MEKEGGTNDCSRGKATNDPHPRERESTTNKMGALDRMTHMEPKSVYEPILIHSQSNMSTSSQLPRFYTGGFEQQKHKWATVNRRSHRIRYISYAQIVLGFLASWNYLW